MIIWRVIKMGYTHYWRINYNGKDLDKKLWQEFISIVRDIISNSNVMIRDGHGKNQPILRDDLLWFNGDDDFCEAFETVLITPIYDSKKSQIGESEFNFTKTGRRPYDVIVVATLLIFKYIFFNQVNISSDGLREELMDGFNIASKYRRVNIDWFVD
jgi:hypothetical protein